MKQLLLVIMIVGIASCNKEQICDEWHTGYKCKTERRFELTGTYSGYETYSDGYRQYKNLDVFTYTDDLQTLTLNNKVIKLLNPEGNFHIPKTSTGNGYSYEGQGSFKGAQLSYGFNTYLNDSLIAITNFQGTK